MIFFKELQEREKVIEAEFDRLIDIAYKNQTHPGDLLLMHVNGFFDLYTVKSNAFYNENKSLYSIGHSNEGLSEITDYKFINQYREKNVSSVTREEYLKHFEWSEERANEISEFQAMEEIGIHSEMSIYIKVWEADMIIKRLYQFVRLINGEPYDWNFKLKKTHKDKKNTGSKITVLTKEIRDRIKDHFECIFNLFKNTYKPQIRNSIAHSNYSMMGRHIQLNNFVENDPFAQIEALSFDEWIDIFHDTMILYNQYIRLDNVINKFYGNIAMTHNNEMQVRIIDNNGKQSFLMLTYRPEWNDWVPKN